MKFHHIIINIQSDGIFIFFQNHLSNSFLFKQSYNKLKTEIYGFHKKLIHLPAAKQIPHKEFLSD